MKFSKEKNVKYILEQRNGYNALKDTKKEVVEQNFLDLIGNLSIVVDSPLLERKNFLNHFFKSLLNINKKDSEKIIDVINNNKDTLSYYINYESENSDYEYVGYKNIIQPVQFMNEHFEDILEEINKNPQSNEKDEVKKERSSKKDDRKSFENHSNDKHLIILSNFEGNQDLYNKFININYDNNIYIIVVDEVYPDAIETNNGAQSSVLTYDFDESEITPIFDYINIDDQSQEIIDEIDKDIKEKLNQIENFEDVFSNFKNHIKNIGNQQQLLLHEISSNKSRINELIESHLEDQLQIEFILDKIIAQNINKKKSEQNEFAEKLIRSKVSIINSSIKHMIEKFNNNTQDSISKIETDFTNISGLKFGNNINSWFASGLAGLGSYGALTIYMSSLGNLGGYILVAKGVSLLSGLGIATGGTAAAIKTVSILGGPIGMAVGAGLGITLLSKTVLGIGWKKSLAKQIQKSVKKKVVPKLKEENYKLWNETSDAIIKGFKEIVKQSRKDFIHRNKDLIGTEEMFKINKIT